MVKLLLDLTRRYHLGISVSLSLARGIRGQDVVKRYAPRKYDGMDKSLVERLMLLLKSQLGLARVECIVVVLTTPFPQVLRPFAGALDLLQ